MATEGSAARAREDELQAALDALVWPPRDDADLAAWRALLAGAVGALVALRAEVERLRRWALEEAPELLALREEVARLRAHVLVQQTALRHLKRVVRAGIFGIPAEEAVRLRDRIDAALRGEEVAWDATD